MPIWITSCRCAELSRIEEGALAEAARTGDAAERDYLAAARSGAQRGATRLTVLMLECHEYEKVERRYVAVLALLGLRVD